MKPGSVVMVAVVLLALTPTAKGWSRFVCPWSSLRVSGLRGGGE